MQITEPKRIEFRDILVVAGYVILTPVAWLLPIRYWPKFTRLIAQLFCPILRRWRPDSLLRIKQAADRQTNFRDPVDIYIDLFAGRIEQEMRYLREYRPGGWQPKLEVTGKEHIDRAIRNQTGAILWCGPLLYSALVIKKALYAAEIPVVQLSRDYHGPSDSRFGKRYINRIAIACENRYLERRLVLVTGKPDTAIRQLLRTLGKGGVVSITCAHYGKRLIDMPILGGKLPVAPGAASLAASTEAPLLPVFVIRKSADCYEIVIEPPLSARGEFDRDEKIRALFNLYAQRVAHYVEQNPEVFTDWRRLDIDT